MNPELRRNLWLELSLHRLIAMPVVLGLGFYVVASFAREWRTGVSTAALMAFFGLVLFWGSRLAGETISDEVRGKTWDLQRMSAISPWSMTWGKLFGSTLFTWYGGAICLAAYLAASYTESGSVRAAVTLVAVSVLLHASIMAATLQAAQKGWVAMNRLSMLGLLVLIFIAIPSMGFFSNADRELFWFGVSLRALDFLMVSSIVFAAWTVLGAYRAMCQELQVRTTPWAWGAFALFVSAYLAGFSTAEIISALSPLPAAGLSDSARIFFLGFLYSGLLVCLSLTYVMLFSERTGPMVLRRILLSACAGQWRRMFEEMPCWPTTFVLSTLFAFGIIIAETVMGGVFALIQTGLVLTPLTLVLLLVRDAAILFFFAFARQARRVETTTIFYLVLLYGLLPSLFNAMELEAIARFIFPLALKSASGSLAAAVQAGIAVALCVRRWRKNFSVT